MLFTRVAGPGQIVIICVVVRILITAAQRPIPKDLADSVEWHPLGKLFQLSD